MSAAAPGLAVDVFSGAATLELPLTGPAARSLGPALSLRYDSRAPSGPCGQGFDLPLASVRRYTGAGVPRYGPEDSFVLDGQPLVPLGEPFTVELADGAYAVTRYAPRADSAPRRVERWERIADGDTCWRRVDRDGVTGVFGQGPSTRIADPADPARVFEWLLECEYDTHGEAIVYEWLAEDAAGVDLGGSERGRAQTAQRYLGAVRYAPQAALTPPPYGIGPMPAAEWHFELLLDYGQYSPEPANANPYQPTGAWLARPDPRSSHRAGFEVRTHRLLRNVLVFHRFDALGSEPALAHLYRLSYDEDPVSSLLVRFDSVGCAPDPEGQQPYAFQPLPPLELRYSERDVATLGFAELGGAPPAVATPPLYGAVDLEGEGAAGVLYADGESVRFSPPAPAGGRGFGPSGAPPDFPLERRNWAGVDLVDLDGDGRADLLVTAATRAGAYPAAETGFEPFAPFESRPAELGGPTAMADLSGDGLPDAVVLERGLVRYYPGQGAAGFGAGLVRAAPAGAPPSLAGDSAALVAFADVLGSGASHLVRVGEGSVECWPSLGYGVFGERVTLADAPSFDGEFDPRRAFLADLSGNGCADLLYAMPDRLLVHVNEAGNGFAAAVELPLPALLEAPEHLALCDLDGSGIPAVVVSELSGAPRHWATEPGLRPGLLTGVVNSLGAETAVAYTSAAACRRADAARGVEWIGRLPFPLEVVAEVEDRDELSGSALTTTYSYHHGFYSAEDRALGFALVERRDTPLLESQPDDPPTLTATPPRLTRTWFATGAFPDETAALEAERFAGDPQAPELPAMAFEWGGAAPSDGETVRQSRAALRGRVLREEVYGLDGAPASSTPYRVDQHSFGVRLVEERGAGPWAAFLVSERERLRTTYERDPADSAVHHDLILEVDAYGSPLLTASVAYPRRPPAAGAPANLPEQEGALASCATLAYANVDDEDSYRVGLPAEAIGYQLFGLPPLAGGVYGFDELAAMVRAALAGDGVARAVVRNGQRLLYYAADGTTPAPLGESGPEGLLRTGLTAAVAAAEADMIFSSVLEPGELGALMEAGYHTLDPATDLWWARSDVRSYAPLASFQRPLQSAEPSGAVLTWSYDATCFALLETRQQASGTLDRTLSVELFDYQALRPSQVCDANGKTIEALHDALGQAVLRSTYGSEAGQRAGFAPIVGVPWARPTDAAALIEGAEGFLGEAEAVTLCDPLAWSGRVEAADLEPLTGDPDGLLAALAAAGYVTPEGAILAAFRALGSAAELVLPAPFAGDSAAVYATLAALPWGAPLHLVTAAAHDYPDRPQAPPRIEVVHRDALGRPLQRRRQVEPADGAERWAIVGAARCDGANLRVAYAPAFGASWAYGADGPLPAPTVCSYDAVGRPIRVDTPKGFLTTTTISAWAVVHADEVDTVLESPYWEAHRGGEGIGAPELEALRQAALSAGTPTAYALDPLGHVVAKTELLNRTTGAAEIGTSLGLGEATAAELYGELRSGGILDFRGALTTAFQPDAPGFALGLSSDLAHLEAATVAYLRGLLGGGEPLTTRYGRDLEGRELWSADPRLVASWSGEEPGPTSFATDYTMHGYPLHVLGADAGERWGVPDNVGRDLWHCDGRGLRQAVSRDPLGRPLSLAVGEPGAESERIAEAYVYGDQLADGAPIVPDPAAANLIGELYRAFDGAGLVQYDACDLLAMPASLSRRFLADPATPVDWEPALAVPGSPALDPTAWTTTRRHDPFGRLVAETDEAGAAHAWTYTRSGWVATVAMALPGGEPVAYVTAVEYDPQGRRESIAYGNGAVTSLAYDPLDQRLVAMQTRVGAAVPQSLAYVYDPVGNVTHVGDAALGSLLGGLGSVSANRDHCYDSLYRLVRAEGPELAALDPGGEREAGYEGLLLPPTAPAAALATARRSHAYDAAGNLYWFERLVGDAGWTGETLVAAGSNRGVPVELCGLAPAPPGDAPPERPLPPDLEALLFDADGNQLRLDQEEQQLDWDYANRLCASNGPAQGLLCGYDAADRLVREVAQPATGAGATTDVLRFESVDVTRATTPGEPTETSSRFRVRDGDVVVAEVLAGGIGDADTAYGIGDLAGSVALRLGAGGDLRSYEAFAPYGATAFASMPDPAEAEEKLDRFGQHRRDRATGLYDYGRRLYSPWSGRWLSPDPSGPVDGLNLYAYVNCNPTSAADPDGQGRTGINRRWKLATRQTARPAAQQGGIKRARSGEESERATKRSRLREDEIEVNQHLTIEVDGARLFSEFKQMAVAFQAGALQRAVRIAAPAGTPPFLTLPKGARRGQLQGVAPVASEFAASFAVRGTGQAAQIAKLNIGPREGRHVHLVRIGEPGESFGPKYAALTDTEQAAYLHQLVKGKALLTADDPLRGHALIMAVSENERGPAGVLAAMALYLAKHRGTTFAELFDPAHPLFPPAEAPGGAAFLKTLKRMVAGEEGVGLSHDRQQRLDRLLASFLRTYVAVKKGKPDNRFAGARSPADVYRTVRAGILGWYGFAEGSEPAKR